MVRIENNKLLLNGKQVGFMQNDILTMKRIFHKHHYYVLDAWCLNVEVVNSGASRFVIETDTERYIISLDKIMKLRSKLNLFVTFGTERQLAIPLKCWDRYNLPEVSFPVFIGIPPDEFVDSCSGRWRSRLISSSQMELAF